MFIEKTQVNPQASRDRHEDIDQPCTISNRIQIMYSVKHPIRKKHNQKTFTFRSFPNSIPWVSRETNSETEHTKEQRREREYLLTILHENCRRSSKGIGGRLECESDSTSKEKLSSASFVKISCAALSVSVYVIQLVYRALQRDDRPSFYSFSPF